MICEAGHPKPVLCDNLEGWSGEGGRRGFKRKGTHVCLWPIYTEYGKNHHNIVKYYLPIKIIFFKIKKKMQYFFDVSEDDVQLCEATGHHLQPINSRRAQRNIPEY